MLEHTLNHTTAVWVNGELPDLTVERVDDELDMLGRYTFNRLLNDVIAVLILHAFQYIVLKFLDQSRLLVGEYVLEGLITLIAVLQVWSCGLYAHLLYNSASIHL